MRKKVALIALITALLITGVTFTVLSQKPTQTAPETPTAQVEQVTEKPKTRLEAALNADTLFELVNAERAKAGLQPLVRDARLDASAQAKADDMVRDGYFDHIDPTTSMHGYDYIAIKDECVYVGENIVRTDRIGNDNTDAINQWKNSKPHLEAMLNVDYDTTGISVNDNIAVQHFCVVR